MPAVKQNFEMAAFGDPEPQPGQQDDQQEAEPSKPGIIGKIRDHFQTRKADRPVQLPNGTVVTGFCAKWLDENEGGEYVGSLCEFYANENQDGTFSKRVPFDPGKHAAAEAQMHVREFCWKPDGGDGYPAIFVIERGKYQHIGHHLAVGVLKRMGDNGILTERGQQLLSEQCGGVAETLAEASR